MVAWLVPDALPVPRFSPTNDSGFVVAGTDMERQRLDPSWSKDPQKRADFAHRANHVTALATERLAVAFYGQVPQDSCFNGGSDVGREALIEAQRYPVDSGDTIAGDPLPLKWSGL